MSEDSTTRAMFRHAIQNLSIPDRIQLVGDIWDSIAEAPEAIPLTDEQKTELDRRLDTYRCDPSAGETWERVRRKTNPGLPAPNHRRK